MNNAKFSREIKTLIHYLREYGIQHINFKFNSLDSLPKEQSQIDEFMTQVHQGFFAAQDRIIYLLKKILQEQKRLKSSLADARRQHNKKPSQEVLDSLNYAKYQERVLRKVMDGIAWQVFHYDLSTLRRLYCGQEPVDITNSNLDSEIRFIEQYIGDNPDGFVLISDLTSFIQVGDVVAISKNDGKKIIELKEGEVNSKVFDLINEVIEVNCPKYLELRLKDENEHFIKHLTRAVKQIDKSSQAFKTISTGYGTDLLTGQEVRIVQDEIELDTYSDIMKKLSEDCHKKGYAISVVEGCLLVGVYDTLKFPSWPFEVWADSLNIKMPIYDMRMSFNDPLSYPIFLHPFSDTFIIKVISGEKVIKMTLDIERWFETLKEAGCTVRWMSKKETARVNSKLKGSNKMFDIDEQGIVIEKDGMELQIGQGIFSRIFTNFNTPSSIKKLLLATFESARKQEDNIES